MKKYLNQIFTCSSLILTITSFLLFLGPVFSKVVITLNGNSSTTNVDFNSFYSYLGEESAYNGLGITILVLMSIACCICVCSLVLKFACNKEIKYLDFVTCILLVVAGILTFFVGIAASSSGSTSIFGFSIKGSISVKLGVCTIISGIVLIISGLVNIVPSLLNKSSK